MYYKKLVSSFIFFFIIFLSINSSKINVYADKPNIVVDDGIIKFYTTDTTATSSTRWKTIGFNITREDSNGDPTNVPYARLMLKSEWKRESVQGGTTFVTFTIPEKNVSQALIKAGFDGIKDKDTIYISCIHQVMHGSVDGRVYNSLLGIQGAEDWKNKKDFEDRFDLEVKYSANKNTPIKMKYITVDGSTILEKYEDNVIPGKLATVHFKNTIDYGGQTLYLSKSYVCYLAKENKRIIGTTNFVTSVNAKDYESQLLSVRTRSKTQVVGGLKFVAVMRPKTEKKSNTNVDYSSIDVEMPLPYGVIAADDRANEKFDVTEGIPTTENLYTNVFTSKYMLGYNLAGVDGTKVYSVQAKKTYNLKWTEKDKTTGKAIEKSGTQIVTQNIIIKRDFSYWKIMNLEYYGIDYASISNYALPNGKVKLTPKDYTVPSLTYIHSAYMADHIKEPDFNNTMTLSSQTVNGGDSKPSIPNEDFTSYVDSKIDKIKVRNDRLTFDGTDIINNNYMEEKTESPIDIEMDYGEVDENVLYESGLTIDKDKTNGIYESTGTVVYKPIRTLNSRIDLAPTYTINNLSNVVIHTPTICDAYISDQSRYNQMINPDKSVASLVLDTNFSVLLSTTGEHRYILGYEYRDYAKYIESRMIKFPFDVYHNNNYIKANTWISLYTDITNFYLPTWVNEGKYTIDCKSISINATVNNASCKTEALANLDSNNYVATDTIDVEISGRIYGLNLYDISDYPIWQTVFRIPNSLSLTGFRYTLGDKDQNGNTTSQNKKYTLPLVNGSHPYYTTIGAIKTGYVTRFSLKTVGNMYGENDYIRMKPTFYFVDKQGNNRQEVDIYYSETIHNKKEIMVKMGSELDLINKKSIRTSDSYLGIPEHDLKQTAYYKGVSLIDWTGQKRNVYTFTNIMIPESLRTFVGFINNVPIPITKQMVAQSVQNWYGEYYLPSEIHVVPKGFNINNYVKYNGAINYKENIWLKNGYVIVNFEIETIQNGKRHLSYINANNAKNGYCNMWNREGFIYNKIDYKGNVFHFIDGDYALYDTDKSAANDYISAGTH